MRRYFSFILLLFVMTPAMAEDTSRPTYEDLLVLHEELEEYMVPGFTGSVVLDSGARVGEVYADDLMADKLRGLDSFDARLAAMDVENWARSEQVEYLAVKSLLNGYRFNLHVLRPWKRDPGFYLDPLMRVAFSEVEGSGDRLAELRAELSAVAPMLAGARANLTEVAGDYADLALFNLENSDGVNHYHPYREVPPAGIIGWYDDLLARSQEQSPNLPMMSPRPDRR